MSFSPRPYALVVVAALFLGWSSTASAKPIYGFSGAGDEGGVVWDGDADVGSMNNLCNVITCTSDTVDLTQLIAEINVKGSVSFANLTVSLLLSVPLDTLPANCGAIVCQSVDDFLTAHFDNTQEFLNHTATGVPQGVVILTFVSANVAQPLSGISALNLSQASIDFLAVPGNAGLLSGAFAGFLVSFHENVAGSLEDPFVAFDVTIQDPNAPVPEPASMLLLGSGLAGLAAKRYRRRTTSQS